MRRRLAGPRTNIFYRARVIYFLCRRRGLRRIVMQWSQKFSHLVICCKYVQSFLFVDFSFSTGPKLGSFTTHDVIWLSFNPKIVGILRYQHLSLYHEDILSLHVCPFMAFAHIVSLVRTTSDLEQIMQDVWHYLSFFAMDMARVKSKHVGLTRSPSAQSHLH